MMGFFVILWVLKPPAGKDQAQIDPKWLEVVMKIREAFKYVPDPKSKDPIDMFMLMKKIEQLKLPMKNPGQGGETTIRRQGAEGTDPEVTTIRPGLQAIVGGRLQFDAGSAQLTPETTAALAQIADQVRGHYNIVLVKGNTSLDDFPDSAGPEVKMDLSIRRAQGVADFLTQHGVEPAILRVQGCSTFEPVVQRVYLPDAQSQNRRVEVEATANLLQDRQDHRSSATTQPILSVDGALAPTTEPAADIR
jgi:outer membrane protein OmpA-like peptidoglycan-associated protein